MTAKEGLFCQLCSELARRNPGDDRPVVCLMDGERALWEAKKVYFAEAVGVLDLFHVMERLWAVSHCLHNEGSVEASRFVAEGAAAPAGGTGGFGHRRVASTVDEGAVLGGSAAGDRVGD